MTTTEIIPALTSEQWSFLRDWTRKHYSNDSDEWLLTAYLEMNTLEVRRFGLPGGVVDIQAPMALIALANAALSDNDPRKITRADVERLRDAAVVVPYTLPGNDLASTLRAIADKLAALLPPE